MIIDATNPDFTTLKLENGETPTMLLRAIARASYELAPAVIGDDGQPVSQYNSVDTLTNEVADKFISLPPARRFENLALRMDIIGGRICKTIIRGTNSPTEYKFDNQFFSERGGDPTIVFERARELLAEMLAATTP